MKKSKIRNLTYIALFVSIMAAVAQLSIPIGAVPVSLVPLAVALSGYLLGIKGGVVATAVYILLGCVGVPVFANFQGGFHMIVGYTCGFIIGFIPFAALCGIRGRAYVEIPLGILGLLVCHLIGVIQYSCVLGVSILASLLVASLPFIIKDIFLTLCAYFISKTLKKRLKI